RASSGVLCGCPRAICRSLLATAPRSRRPRAGSWPCRQSGWPRGWRLTCPSWTSWSSRSTGCTSATTWYWSLPSALMEKATNIRSRCSKEQPRTAAAGRALTHNLIERGFDPKVCRLFITAGAKALSKVTRRPFGAHTPIQRCQIHKARNVIERLAKPLHAPVRRALRQAWELDDADKAERLVRNLARRLDHEAPGVAPTNPPGPDGMLTVNRLGLPVKLRRSLACTNSIENMMGTVRRVCRNVKRWRNAAMALRWTAAGMMEAAKGFRRLKAYKHLPVLKAALAAHQSKYVTQRVEQDADAA